MLIDRLGVTAFNVGVTPGRLDAGAGEAPYVIARSLLVENNPPTSEESKTKRLGSQADRRCMISTASMLGLEIFVECLHSSKTCAGYSAGVVHVALGLIFCWDPGTKMGCTRLSQLHSTGTGPL